MISVEKLKKVKKIIVHKFCHDGTSSAMIIKDVLHDVEIFLAGHKDKEYLEMKAEPGLLFCDIAPPPCNKPHNPNDLNPQCCIDRKNEFIQAECVILDHHEKVKDLVLKYQSLNLGVYGESDEGVSGAVLAFKYVWEPLEHLAKTNRASVQRLSELAGIRDTFQTKSNKWDISKEQTETLAFYPYEYWLENHIAGVSNEEMKIGKIICERNESILKRIVENPFILHWNSRKVAILPGHKIISDAAEEFRKKDIPITISFGFRINDYGSPVISCSVRSDGTFDCNKFAGYFDGGGHIKAAGGLTIPVKDKTLNPYSCLKIALEEFGKECLIE